MVCPSVRGSRKDCYYYHLMADYMHTYLLHAVDAQMSNAVGHPVRLNLMAASNIKNRPSCGL